MIHGYEGDSLQMSFPPGLGKVTLLSQQMQNSSLALSNTSCPMAKGLAVGNEACDFQFSFPEPGFAGFATHLAVMSELE